MKNNFVNLPKLFRQSSLGYGIDYVYHGNTVFKGIHKNDVLALMQREMEVFNCNSVSNLYPEYYIIKVKQFDDVAKDTLDEWINFLKGGDVRQDTLAKGLIAAQKKLNVLQLRNVFEITSATILVLFHFCLVSKVFK